MSLKEWKNNEINTKLMKKWGFLKEGTTSYRRDDEDDYKGIGSKEHDDEEGNRPSMAKDMDLKEDSEREDELEEGCGDISYRSEDDEELEEVFGLGTSADEKRKKLANRPDFSAGGPQEDDPGVDPPTAWALQKAKADKLPKDTRTRSPRRRSGGGGSAAGSRNVFTMGENSGKISVKEAKEITRRIIERIKKEHS